MAEEENTEEAQGSGTKSKKKLIVIIVLVAILAVGLSVGVTLFLLSDDKGSELEDIAAEVEVVTPSSYLEIQPAFLITFNVEGRQRYMQISMSASSRDASVFSSVEYHMPLIRSRLISAYGGMDFDVIKTEAGKVSLQTKTVEIINSVLKSEGEGQIENIYFTNFVLQ